MANDINLAKYVNILRSDRNDIPNDVYSYMVKKVNEKLFIMINKSYEYSKLDFLNINRKFIKRGIMTIPYGVNIRGITNQLIDDHFQFEKFVERKKTFTLKENIFNKKNVYFYLNNKEIYCLGKIIHDVLYDSFPSLKILVNYLKNMNKTLKILNLKTI